MFICMHTIILQVTPPCSVTLTSIYQQEGKWIIIPTLDKFQEDQREEKVW